MRHILVCDSWCNGIGIEEAERLGLPDPEEVKRKSMLRLDRVVAMNEDASKEDPSTWVYFEDIGGICAAMPFDEILERYMQYARSEFVDPLIIKALAAVAEAIEMDLSRKTVREGDWNPEAHVEVTLTIRDARMVFDALETLEGRDGKQNP